MRMLFRSVAGIVLLSAALCRASPSSGGDWVETTDEPVLNRRGQIDEGTSLGARVERRNIGKEQRGSNVTRGVEKIIQRHKVLQGSTMLPVSLFDGKMHKNPARAEKEQELLTKFVTTTKLADFSGPCQVAPGEDPARKCPIRTLFSKIKKVCVGALGKARGGHSALKNFEEPKDEPEEVPEGAELVDAGWGKIQDHNYGLMAAEANSKFKAYYETQVKALKAACKLKIKEAESGVDFLQVQDSEDPVASFEVYWQGKVAALYPKICAIGSKAEEEQSEFHSARDELATLLAGDRAEAKRLGLFVPDDPNEPTGYERDMNKNRKTGEKKEAARRRLQQLVGQWVDEVYGTQERLKESCSERLKILQRDQPKESIGVESQLDWPQGMNPGRTRIPKPFSVVQTSDVNSENGFARSVSTNLILEDILEASKARLEITNMIQAEWGGQDTGLNTGGMKKSLEKLRQEWEHKFKKLKAVIDTRCRERVGAAKANAQAKETASKNL